MDSLPARLAQATPTSVAGTWQRHVPAKYLANALADRSDGRRGAAVAVPNRRGRRHPHTRRSVARIKARRQAKAAMRQSRSARTSATNQPTALAA